MLVRENFDGPHVGHNRRTLPQDSRARQADGRELIWFIWSI